jgi:hypothetical protein
MLEDMDGIDGRVIHLVRDPRATVHSWADAKRQDFHGPASSWTEELPPRGAVQATTSWIAYNTALSAVVAHRSLPYRLVRYEDLVTDPVATTAAVAAWCGLEPSGLPIEADGTAHLAAGHSPSGNIDRLLAGAVVIAPRDTWHGAMPRRQAEAVSLATAALRWRYAYPRHSRADA